MSWFEAIIITTAAVGILFIVATIVFEAAKMLCSVFACLKLRSLKFWGSVILFIILVVLVKHLGG